MLPPENVQDYPRPPRLEPLPQRIVVRLGGRTIADTARALRVLETHHAPTYYMPPDDMQARLDPASGSSFCEWKGRARYFDVSVEGTRAPRAAWSYDAPSAAFADLAGFGDEQPDGPHQGRPRNRALVNGQDPLARPGVAVPSRRLSRLGRMGGLAGGIAGAVVAGGLRQAASGRRPRIEDLLLTPGNAHRVADELSKMRGAAMKVGQLMSMDAGDLLRPEMTAILDRLRSDAAPMPPRQLRDVLDAEWGRDWIRRFERFDVRPIAAASIGQVHRARTRDGRDLALKVQYPGIRASIDSDIANIAGLIRWSGAAPQGLDLRPLMEDARRQLHEEADYVREGENLDLFGRLMAGAPEFIVPRRHPDFCTRSVLAMDYLPGTPVEDLAASPQEVRDEVARRLISLVLRELFGFKAMQTDPNFANYLVEPGTDRIVLLDFGAVRSLSPASVEAFRRLMRAGLLRDWNAAREAAIAVGLMGEATPPRQQETLLRMFDTGMAAIRAPGPFNFGTSDLALRLRDIGLELGAERDIAHVPPSDTLLVQRKVAGTYLLTARLRARVDVARIASAHG